MVFETFSEKETFEIGKNISAKVKPGDVFCLQGDLGVGKTVFTKGFAQGLGIDEDICSPTFTLISEYTQGTIPLYHFDVYRLEGAGAMDDLGFDDYIYGEGVCLIEWGNLIKELLPKETIYVNIQKDLEKGFEYRRIEILGGDF